jgi:hypothetical protein
VNHSHPGANSATDNSHSHGDGRFDPRPDGTDNRRQCTPHRVPSTLDGLKPGLYRTPHRSHSTLDWRTDSAHNGLTNIQENTYDDLRRRDKEHPRFSYDSDYHPDSDEIGEENTSHNLRHEAQYRSQRLEQRSDSLSRGLELLHQLLRKWQ